MDPVGKQKRIPSNEYHVSWQKLVSNDTKGGGAKDKYDGNRNMKSGTHPAREGKLESKWQGTVKGGTKHTYKGE